MEDRPLKREISDFSFPTSARPPKPSFFSRMKTLLRSKEGIPTDLSHLYLNDEGSSWANLGYWKEEVRYGKACEHLANHLGTLGELGPGSRILDLGFGCGDQFQVWEKEFGVSIQNIYGINVSKSQYEYTRSRYKNSESSPNLILGSVKALSKFPENYFDSVLGLDSLYFIPNRKSWSEEVYRILKPGGVFASAEILLADRKNTFFEILKRSLIIRLASISGDLSNAEGILSLYSSKGFRLETIERIDPFVFSGFSNFLFSHIKDPSSRIPQSLKGRYEMLAEYLASETIKKHFEYWMYKVRKPESDPLA
ncbi:SAM-dependent methyltransferase [Leptospira semungkisensis]|uniref:SAM-dependent methyltransferase n=1 Tax=Leptospira semungkisensis TaxID=2484985 RepID=A0A4R9G8B5_9LEPT|nr:class I SAM-dependent methyltransferase [Leptospira semungkisensis]TGK07505.1 SAM-dependent methyltransferase [Leptospira semungkisensis]